MMSSFSFEAIGFALTSWLAGNASDRLGRKPFVALAQPLIILACLGLAVSSSLWALISLYTLFGVAGAATFLMSTTMMADIAPPARSATYLGAFDALIDLGILVAPALALSLHKSSAPSTPSWRQPQFRRHLPFP